MEKQHPDEGRNVKFFPSNSTKKKFKNVKKDSYPAVVTQANELTVDLTVFGVGEIIHVERVPHLDVAGNGRSHWVWPTIK